MLGAFMNAASLLCGVLGHRRKRNKVWHDGVDYRAPCVRCGIPMVRDMTGWREFDLAIYAPDGSQQRNARPSHHG